MPAGMSDGTIALPNQLYWSADLDSPNCCTLHWALLIADATVTLPLSTSRSQHWPPDFAPSLTLAAASNSQRMPGDVPHPQTVLRGHRGEVQALDFDNSERFLVSG